MTRRLIKNGLLTPDENAEPGIYWDQMGCPDVRLLCPTLDHLLKSRKVTQAALSGFLAIVKSYYEALGRVPHEYQGACNAPIPVEVITLIGEKLVSKARWSKAANAAKTEAALKQDAKLQAEANAVWLSTPNGRRGPSLSALPPTNGITSASGSASP
jgi:hypothetical protein